MEDRQRAIRDAIIESVFPDLRYGGDPDVERYFELRSAGRVSDALAVYNGRLKARYPDDARRIVLLGMYRRRNPHFAAFQRALLDELADTLVSRIKATIDALVAPIAGLSPKDAYRTLKAVERVVDMLPADETEALRALDLYERHAKLLEHRAAAVARLRFLAGEFFAQSREDEYDDDELLARTSAKAEEEDRKRASERNFFDLSRIEFAREDVERIEIPQGIERREDRVLAFCHKYWLHTNDPGFERVVHLYSRKYDTQHYAVLRAIRIGRERRYTDDEILNVVDTLLSSSYSYSVQSDLYMQTQWRALKARLYGLDKKPSAMPGRSIVDGPEAESRIRTTRAQPAIAQAAGVAGVAGEASDEPARPILRRPKAAASPASGKGRPASASSALRQARAKAHLSARSERGASQDAARSKRASEAAATPLEPLKRMSAKRRQLAPPRSSGVAPGLLASSSPSGSISERLKRLSGRAYDVYRDSFFERAPDAVKAHLEQCRRKPRTLFDESGNKAENVIMGFLKTNYANPYLDWAGSAERAEVAKLGFEVPDIDPVIAEAWRRIA